METGDTLERGIFSVGRRFIWYTYISAQDIDTQSQRAREEVAERVSIAREDESGEEKEKALAR